LLLTALTVTLAPLAVRLPDAVPLVPTTTLPRPMAVGLAASVPVVAVVPVPDNGMDKDGLDASEPIVMLAPKVPAAVDKNFALTVQLAPGASVPGTAQVPMLPQVNDPALMKLVRKLTVALPVFVRVLVRMELFCPTAMLPKAMIVGLAVSLPIADAVTATVALAYLVVSATRVALTVTVVFAVTVGAVNSPVVLTVPAVADQVTAVLLVFVT